MKKPGVMTKEVLSNVLRKPATIRYPFEKIVKPKDFRGKLKFYAEKCIGCKLCMKDCPSNAITIVEVGPKKYEAIVDLDKCIFCGQCVDSCAKKALESTTEYELASLDKKTLKVKI